MTIKVKVNKKKFSIFFSGIVLIVVLIYSSPFLTQRWNEYQVNQQKESEKNIVQDSENIDVEFEKVLIKEEDLIILEKNNVLAKETISKLRSLKEVYSVATTLSAKKQIINEYKSIREAVDSKINKYIEDVKNSININYISQIARTTEEKKLLEILIRNKEIIKSSEKESELVKENLIKTIKIKSDYNLLQKMINQRIIDEQKISISNGEKNSDKSSNDTNSNNDNNNSNNNTNSNNTNNTVKYDFVFNSLKEAQYKQKELIRQGKATRLDYLANGTFGLKYI